MATQEVRLTLLLKTDQDFDVCGGEGEVILIMGNNMTNSEIWEWYGHSVLL